MLTLHSLFNDHAVLQCEKPVSIRGTAVPRTSVALHFAGCDQQTIADDDGRWTIALPALPPGGPHELIVKSGSETLRHSGIMLGEVWLCSGQSNMEWTLGMLGGAEGDIAEANDPLLRCFTVSRLPANEPATNVTGQWQVTTPLLARDFSATAYFFGRRLRAATGRPVGLVVSAFGGTVIASWLPKAVLTSRPEYRTFLTEKSTSGETTFIPHPYESRTPMSTGWESVELDEADWKTLSVPGYWQNQDWRHNGSVWYRRTIALSPDWIGREMTLELGACDDFDDTFVNGTRVGGIGPEAPSAYATRRVYPLPTSLTTTDRLTIAVRVFDHWGNGGIMGDSLLRRADAPEETFSLAGSWKAKVEKALPLRAPGSGVPPTLLYQGMIHPLVGFAVRGFLWYQGESDLAQAALYRRLLPDLIGAWRALWGDPLLPFGIVQIANHQARSPHPAEDERAELRDAQLLAAQTVPAVGLAVTIDIGESDNIHPRQKRPVGERLARWALAEVYGRSELPWSSPLPADHWTENQAIHVRFNHTGNGLRPRGGAPLQGFQIAGSDRQWRWAEATVAQADIVRVSARIVKEPVAVRYAWADPIHFALSKTPLDCRRLLSAPMTGPSSPRIDAGDAAKPAGLIVMYPNAAEEVYGDPLSAEISGRVELLSPALSAEALLARPDLLECVEVIFSGWGAPVMDGAFFEKTPRLRAIFYAAGTVRGWATDNVWQRGIVVTTASAANAIPVADYTVATLFFSLKNGWHYARGAKRLANPTLRTPCAGAFRSKIGLISLGMVARLVVERLKSSDLEILVHDPHVSPGQAAKAGVTLVSLMDLFRECDVVSLHAPLLPETRSLIGREHFAVMKQGATFINTARGEIVRENELIEILTHRRDLTAVLDVTAPEPPVENSPLYTLPNVVLTPHIAGSLGGECRRLGQVMVDEFDRWSYGEPLRWQLTREKAALMA